MILSLPISSLKFWAISSAQSMLNILETPILETMKFSCMLTYSRWRYLLCYSQKMGTKIFKLVWHFPRYFIILQKRFTTDLLRYIGHGTLYTQFTIHTFVLLLPTRSHVVLCKRYLSSRPLKSLWGPGDRPNRIDLTPPSPPHTHKPASYTERERVEGAGLHCWGRSSYNFSCRNCWGPWNP